MVDWNERYRQQELKDAPHPIVVQFASQLTPGRALDLACGTGRHAMWLAEHGWKVTAVDYARVGIDILKQRAAAEKKKKLVIDARVANLEAHEFEVEPNSYDLVVVCNYLQRDLFPSIRRGTRVGGVVIAVNSMLDDDPDIKPMNPAYLVSRGELRAQFEGWKLLWYFEGKSGEGPQRAIAQVVARRIS